jgi:hypothetical protein
VEPYGLRGGCGIGRHFILIGSAAAGETLLKTSVLQATVGCALWFGW